MMKTRVKVISIVSIIALILAIAVGIVLSAAATSNNSQVRERAGITNTDVTIDAKSSTRTDETIPDGVDVTEIATAEGLQEFINLAVEDGHRYYGILTADIALDWSGVGSQAYLAEQKTIDGNGHTVTLSDAQAIANVSNKTDDNASLSGSDGVITGVTEQGFTDGLEDKLNDNNVAKRNYGMFVDFNFGTIKNIKFVYSQSAHSVANNSSIINRNYVGIVCGTNTGKITNCDLTASGEFGFYYVSGSLSEDNYAENSRPQIGYASIFGGIAGRNAGVISGITAQYSNFTCNINTRAQNATRTLGITIQRKANAETFAGGIAGKMYSTKAEISNIIILAKENVSLNLVAQRNTSSAETYRAYAAVVVGNSSYSRAEGNIGASADTQAKLDNIIVDFAPKLNDNIYFGKDYNTYTSRNAVVFCGKATNVTMLEVTNAFVNNQHVDYQTDHCNCVSANSGSQHEMGYGNVIHTGNYSNVTVGFDEEYNQVITVEPKDKEKSMLGEIAFNKYSGRSTTTEESVVEPGVPDDKSYSDSLIPNNSSQYLYNKVDIRQDKYTVRIKPYQEKSDSFWEIGTYSYQIASIANQGASEHTYTGEDFLQSQLKYTTLSGDKTGNVNPEGLNARTIDSYRAVREGILPCDCVFTLEEKEAGLSYVDTQNQVVAFVEETPTQYPFKINLAVITPLNENWIGENWLSSQQDFTFELAGGIEGAANGYVYRVNGSQLTDVSGLVMVNDVDTRSEGREYTVSLTKDGVVVTQPYTFKVKVDLTSPTAEIIHYEHPTDQYFTHNKITISAADSASGVASIVMNSYGADGIIDYTHNIIDEGILNQDGTYTWQFQDTGRKEIVVTDNVGHSSVIEVNVKIDRTVPTLTVDAYYFAEDTENGQVKTPYTDSLEVTSAVYFDASATFGESGGEIRYSLDNGSTWQVYDGTLIVKKPAEVKFTALSNTYEHDADDVPPYSTSRPLADNWDDRTLTVNIQLQQVAITLDDIVIDGAAKTFDGSDTFYGTVRVRENFAADNGINGEVTVTSVKYASINANSAAALVIEVICTDDSKIIDNQIEGAVGAIEKKPVNITVEDKTKIYGVSLPELTYIQEGMVAGYEEDVQLYVQKPQGYDGTYELLPKTADGEGYVISLVHGDFTNYVLGSVTEGRLRVTLAPVDRLVYERGQFTGLDLDNIASRNLEIGFIRSNGNYERLDVAFYARDIHVDSSTGLPVDNGYTLKVDDITKAGAGFFKVVISLPENDAQGLPLHDKYVMDAKITEFMIKIIDSAIFEKDEEDVEDTQQDETVTTDGGNPIDVGRYENGATDTDNANTIVAVSPDAKNNGYVLILAIFCSVALSIAAALGVGRVIIKKVKSK